MAWLWPHLWRLWASVGAAIVGLTVTYLYSLISAQPLPYLPIVADHRDGAGTTLATIYG